MAILWSHRAGDTRYEVRAAGSSLRLYNNGVLHSQFSERCPATGSVWDLLWLPALFRVGGMPRRILLLGAGAGTVIRQLNTVFGPLEITAVESDPIHLQVAREHFGVSDSMAKLELADADEFVGRYRGRPFDLVIDDLFGGRSGVATRARNFNGVWFRKLKRCLARDGILSINFADREDRLGSVVGSVFGSGKRFRSGFELRAPGIENVVCGLLPFNAQSADLRAHLQATPQLSALLQRGRLRFSVRVMKSAPPG